ncbi:MAG: ATP-binding cassette domain-containing protein [Pseudomonadota bacterium]
MINLSNIALRRGRRVLFERATFQLHAGQKLGVIGANGCGKSSLFSLLLGELEADDGALGLDARDVIAHVAQESPSGSESAVQFVVDGDAELRAVQAALVKAEEQGDDVHRLHERLDAIDGYTAESRASRLLHGLGFASDTFNQSVGAFSGGWRMRLNLARALMCRSDILLLDEPTNHLDLPAILWLERWLSHYPGILMVVSHDRDFLDQICTRIAHIENQSIRLYTGNYSQFEAQRAEHLAQQQALFERQQKEIAHIQRYVDRFRYKASKARQAQSRLKMLERMEKIAPAHVDSPFRFHFPEPKKQPHHLLGLTDASAGYDDVPVLTDITLNLSAGERIGLLGVNGAGKSTLVKALANGATMLNGERTLSKDTHIGYFAQHQLDLLRPQDSPYDHLARVAPLDKEQVHRDFLGRFGFSGERIFEPVAPFSGGEKARLVLALMIRQAPNLLLLDEPTNHLDLDMRQALSIALIEYSGALVVISHDRHLLRSVCDELLIVDNGRVERFTQSLDDYPQWLREQAADTEVESSSAPAATPNKKALRQQQAERRRALKPFQDAVNRIERELSQSQVALTALDSQLADESLYTDAARSDERTQVLKEHAALKSRIETLEWEWFDANERVEHESARLDDMSG